MENNNNHNEVDALLEGLLGGESDNKPLSSNMRDSVLLTEKGSTIGVLKSLITASLEDNDNKYRQALLLSCFDNVDDCDDFCNALDERKRYGCKINDMVDWLYARSAVHGARGGRTGLAVEALTHQSLTATGNANSILKRWFNKKNETPTLP